MDLPMQPYGQALTDYFNGDHSATEILIRDNGHYYELPVFIFFREAQEFSIIEKKALDLCFGKVLDIGAGSGIHSLELQTKDLKVTAIDISFEAVEIMNK